MSAINRRTALKTLGIATVAATTTLAGYKVGESQSDGIAPQPPALAPAGGNSSTNLFPFEGVRQAGIVTPPPEAVLLAALDVTVTERAALLDLFKQVTARSRALMGGDLGEGGQNNPDFPPKDNTGELGFDILKDGHLSVTVGLGASFFEQNGTDRFGLAHYKPLALKPMPADLPGDKLNLAQSHGDMFLQLSSDHPLYNLHTLRDILRHTKGQLQARWVQAGFQRFFDAPVGQATARGLLGFKDGTANLDVNDAALMEQLVWTGSEEPTWAQGGTYAAVRIIREQIESWDRLALAHQEAIFGRHKVSGATLDSTSDQESQPPNYAADPAGSKIPLTSHMRKANPRQGLATDQRRILRRGYLYMNGIDSNGLLDAGFLFMAFCRNIEQQFEYVKRNYMSNPNYPHPDTGIQELDQFLTCVGGGYFFVPPGVKNADRFLGDTLLLG